MKLKGRHFKSHKVRIILSLFCTLTISLVSIAQDSNGCLAVITDLSGDVAVLKESSKKLKAAWGVQLFEGDKIITSKGSKVSLLFSNGNIINLGANSNLEISGNEKTSGKTNGESKYVNSAMMANFSALTIKRKEDREVGVISGLRDVDRYMPIELISPCNTFIGELDPAFYWKPNETMEQFQVKLYNSKGLVWSRKVTGNHLEYPDDEKRLEYGGSYFWNVEGEVMLDSFKSINREFKILSREQMNQLEEQVKDLKELFNGDINSTGYHSLLGACYMNSGLYENAINEFKVVSEINPDSALPHEILGNLYTITGNKDRAISELQKALEINKRESRQD